MYRIHALRISNPPISNATWRRLTAKFNLPTPVLHYGAFNPVGKSRIGISRFPLSMYTGLSIPQTTMHVRALSSMSLLPCCSIGYRKIAISHAVVPLYARTPKCRTPTLRDLAPCVPTVINDSDPLRKSLIMISCTRLLAPEILILQ
jgi:hypothetical protein